MVDGKLYLVIQEEMDNPRVHLSALNAAPQALTMWHEADNLAQRVSSVLKGAAK